MSEHRVTLAGAGISVINLVPELFPIDGFEGSRDQLHARALVLADSGVRTVVLSLELPSLRDYEVDVLRPMLADVATTEVDRVWVGVSHTLAAPHVRSLAALEDPDVASRNAVYCTAIEDAARAAVEAAVATLEPCRIGSAQADVALNINRDDANGYSDHTATVVRVDAEHGTPVALLYSLDLRPSITQTAARDAEVVCADGVGHASRALEVSGAGVAIFVAGAMADQQPHLADGVGADAFAAAERFGALLAGEVRDIAAAIATAPIDRVTAGERHLLVPLKPGGNHDLSVSVLRIGDLDIVGLRPELGSAVGRRLRDLAEDSTVLVWTMLNGGAKYLVEDDDHRRGTATALASPFAPGAADAVVEAVAALIRPVLQEQS